MAEEVEVVVEEGSFVDTGGNNKEADEEAEDVREWDGQLLCMSGFMCLLASGVSPVRVVGEKADGLWGGGGAALWFEVCGYGVPVLLGIPAVGKESPKPPIPEVLGMDARMERALPRVSSRNGMKMARSFVFPMISAAMMETVPPPFGNGTTRVARLTAMSAMH